MPQAATADTGPLAASPPPLASKDPLADYQAAQTRIGAEGEAADKTELSGFKEADRIRSDATPPKLEQIPSPTPKQTDPQKVWASSAMVLAAFGSLFTRQPLTAAMNAAASAIKGFHQGDQEAFDTAFKSWQVASKNATELYEYQQKEYDRILDRADKMETMTMREREVAQREMDGEMRAATSNLRDPVMYEIYKQDGPKAAAQASESRARQLKTFAEATKANEDMHAAQKEQEAYNKSGEANPRPGETGWQTAQRIAKDHQKIWGKVPGGYTPGDNSPADQRLSSLGYNEYLKQFPKDTTTGQPIGAEPYNQWHEENWPGYLTDDQSSGRSAAPAGGHPAAAMTNHGQHPVAGGKPIPLPAAARGLADGTVIAMPKGSTHHYEKRGNELIPVAG